MSVIVVAVISSGISALFYEQSTKLGPQKVPENFNNTYSITEFKLPDKNASPLFPVYDKDRNVIWVGDTKVNSSRIWEFDVGSKRLLNITSLEQI